MNSQSTKTKTYLNLTKKEIKEIELYFEKNKNNSIPIIANHFGLKETAINKIINDFLLKRRLEATVSRNSS